MARVKLKSMSGKLNNVGSVPYLSTIDKKRMGDSYKLKSQQNSKGVKVRAKQGDYTDLSDSMYQVAGGAHTPLKLKGKNEGILGTFNKGAKCSNPMEKHPRFEKHPGMLEYGYKNAGPYKVKGGSK